MEKNFYITTTLPYTNSDPHIGFALEMIQADTIARYKRAQGFEVFFNTGTDEHGLKIYEKARKMGFTPKELCDRYAAKFKSLKEALNLSFNSFIRTTDENHIESAKEFWKRSLKNGDIYKKNYKAKYCVGCELFKTDSELENGKCPLHPTRKLEIIEEENYFFRFSKYQKPLLDFYEANPRFVVPQFRFEEIRKFVKEGLHDFSVSRVKERMPWGIPVPGDEEQVMYVWFDALVNYISALGWPHEKEKFNTFWPGVQVAGKDNLRQQAATWQAMLMSAGVPNSSQVLVHGFITSGGQKMSKSLGNVVDPFELVKKYGSDPVRYYFLREFSPFRDGDFTYERFEERYNADLANGLGNFVSRVLSMADKVFEKEVSCPPDREFKRLFSETEERARKNMENYLFNEALASIWGMISFMDTYIEKKRPWETKDEKTLTNLLAGVIKAAELIRPFLPETSEKIFKKLSIKKETKPWEVKIKKGEALFPRL